jgi:murein DD-endopeptidase MepM/ murein hydrolase activator NlpD
MSVLFVSLILLLTQIAEQNVTIEMGFTRLPQGRLGEIQVAGEGLTKVHAAFLDHQFLLPWEEETALFHGWVAAPIDAEAGWHRLSLLLFFEDGRQQYESYDVQVVNGVFAEDVLRLPTAMERLVAPDVSRQEYTLLDSHLSGLSPWDAWSSEGLQVPFTRPPIAAFGSYRSFSSGDGSVQQRHTGLDYPMPISTPVAVAADGEVVFSGRLPIRGRYILVDHGSGLMTGYAHLSERYVEAGDFVLRGDIIGSVGDNGRSLGPHLHWEAALGGVWINPLELNEAIQ